MNMKEEVKILFKRTHELAKLPVKANPEAATGDSGYDVFAVEQVVIPARGSAVIPIGLQCAFITLGYWFRIEPKSGLGFKHGLQPLFADIPFAWPINCIAYSHIVSRHSLGNGA
jgi:dUTPase